MTPSQLYQAKLTDGTLEQDPAQISVLPLLDDACLNVSKPLLKKWFTRQKPEGGGLYIWGDVGRGKTMLMDIFFHALPSSVSKKRTHFHAFMLDIHARLNKLRADGKAHAYLQEIAKDIAAQNRVLCFDEFHVTDIADAMILGPLFKALLNEGLFIVATSNWPPEQLYKDGLQRAQFLPFIDILRTHMDVIELKSSTDHRLKTLTAQGVYFTNNGAHFSLLFKQLALHLSDTPTQALTIANRSIPAIGLSADIGWFSFDTLCKEPRGASDYLAIADACSVVLLEAVPFMNDDRIDWAKRFMTLIDILYDMHRVVIIGAGSPIQALYSGTRLAFEFERTKSRLIEMQHPDWFSLRLQAKLVPSSLPA